MIAGRDTTAQALSWTVFNLSQHPEVEAEMLSEVQRVLGTDPLRSPAPFQPFRSPEDEAPEGGLVHGGAAEAAEGKGAGRDRGSSHGSAADTPGRRAPVTYATISKGLKYTQAVLQETLRLYPSGEFFERDDEISNSPRRPCNQAATAVSSGCCMRCVLLGLRICMRGWKAACVL